MKYADDDVMKVQVDKVLYRNDECNHKILTRFHNFEMIREYCGDESVMVEDIVAEEVLLAAEQYELSRHIFPCMVNCPCCNESIFLLIGDESNSFIPTGIHEFEDYLLGFIEDARWNSKPERSEYRYK